MSHDSRENFGVKTQISIGGGRGGGDGGRGRGWGERTEKKERKDILRAG